MLYIEQQIIKGMKSIISLQKQISVPLTIKNLTTVEFLL